MNIGYESEHTGLVQLNVRTQDSGRTPSAVSSVPSHGLGYITHAYLYTFIYRGTFINTKYINAYIVIISQTATLTGRAASYTPEGASSENSSVGKEKDRREEEREEFIN